MKVVSAWYGSLVEPRPPAPGAGTSIPVARKRSCETGLSWEMLRIVRSHSVSRFRPDVHGPPLWRVLAFLGFWVQWPPSWFTADVAAHPAHLSPLRSRHAEIGGKVAESGIWRACQRRPNASES